MSFGRAAISFVLLSLCTACAPRLGDGCENNVDCSVTGGRQCDTSQPGGYCTIANCTSATCGDEGVCVRFRPDEPRLSADWCMASCEDTGDCGRDAYVCKSAAQLNPTDAEGNPTGKRIAEVLGGKGGGKFCVAKE